VFVLDSAGTIPRQIVGAAELVPNCRDGVVNDADRDGICDNVDPCPLVSDAADVCSATPPGAPVLANGCAVAQECACTAPWKNHGAYVTCVAHAANELVAAGRITQSQKDSMVAAAGQSSCGVKR
jgi:hypothetical protein